MTGTTLKIDQAKLFEACDHNKQTMATILALLEVMGHEPIEVTFAHAFTNRDVAYYRDQIRKALGVASG